ncbi:outer membrane receptor for ferrienterochelin and colicin [Novosphingobium sp. AP12]|nr:outer membrane receptor for ferrienterochelin and colicin [Novosphingobium sp. AP12]
MGIRFLATMSLAIVGSLPERVDAQSGLPPVSLTIPAGPLSRSLTELSKRTGVGILFAPAIVEPRRVGRVAGRMNVEEGLRQLLANSGLTYRRTAVGSYIIERAPEQPSEPAVPEVLVIGRKTQNTDIRRSPNDMQPYRVFAADEMATSQSDNPDQFLRTRLTNNSSLQGPGRDPAAHSASNRSEINLNGLGANQTLILVDGGRMPVVPYITGVPVLLQSDLNGIPLAAIARIETLTATAGGIYGPGAIGGMVNVVLKRDYRGADVAVSYGTSARSDSPRRRIDARIGFTPDGGRTDAMITVSQTDTHGLEAGRRDYARTVRQIQLAQNPSAIPRNPPLTNAVTIRNLLGTAALSLKPALGGGSLGSSFTYLPIGSNADIASVLRTNAGTVPGTLAQDASGARRNLISDTHVTSILANIRHRFGDRVEGFVDFLGSQNNGRANASNGAAQFTVLRSAATNPLQQDLSITFPASLTDGDTFTHLRTYRASAGLILSLSPCWKLEATYSVGGVDLQTGQTGTMLNNTVITAIARGQPATAGGAVLNPFGDWSSFLDTLASNRVTTGQFRSVASDFRDAQLRLAGTVISAPAGPITLTLLGERRTDAIRDATNRFIVGPQELSATGIGFSQTITSAYAELRTPLISTKRAASLLRGLELQLALRFDENGSRIPSSEYIEQTSDFVSTNNHALAYTAGLRFYPRPGLMIRASASTGTLPPLGFQLLGSDRVLTAPTAPDPKRPGRFVGGEGVVSYRSAGRLDLKPERGRSLALGIVVNPEGGTRPRISVDYTHIWKKDEILIDRGGDLPYFLANESIYSDRIIRAPLTERDRMVGMTAGIITSLDASYLNAGSTSSETVDMSADFGFSVEHVGRFHWYGTATWQPRLSRRMTQLDPKLSFVGFSDGPLRWRANTGIEWRNYVASVGLNGQYYGGYRAINRSDFPATVQIDETILVQKGVQIAPQFYLDLVATYRLRLSGSMLNSIVLRGGMQNVMDHRPPYARDTPLGYSYLGDPRRRRFELSLAAQF